MINEETIRKWWNIFKNGSDLVEIRILGKFAYSGYYKDIDKLIDDIKPYADMPDEQIYFTLNDIDDGCYGRAQSEKILKSPKTTTSDGNITKRSWVLIDFDPVRVVGTNATDDELELAHRKAQRVFSYLRKYGFSDPVICRSGNGWHLQYKCDMPNTDEIRDMLSQFLQSISLMFTDDKVDIDESVFNAARICKLYGTIAKKGANLPERPWRMSEIVYVPEDVRPTDVSLFRAVANIYPKDEPKQQQNHGVWNNESFDLERFLNEHGVLYKKESCAKWTKFVLDHCFFNPDHKGKDAAIVQMQSGAIKYVCYHNSCQHHTWQEMRQALDPHAYEQRQSTHQQPRRLSQNTQPRTIIQQETEELGKKWLSVKDINRVNVNDIEHFKTGFHELDRRIKGLFLCELTILSGSNASGKSSLLNTLVLNVIEQGYKVALWSGELRPDVLKSWVQMVAAGKSNLKLDEKNNYWYVPNDVASLIDEWLDGKLFIYNNEYGAKWEQIFSDMKELIGVGVRIFILDNLFSLDIDIFDGDNNNKQKELVKQIHEFAKKENAHIILVAHPRKTVSFIRKNDISGTANITDAADNILILHRVNNDFRRSGAEFLGPKVVEPFFEYGNVIEVAKNRMMGVQDYLVGLYYELESRRFKNTENEDTQYGWRAHEEKRYNLFGESESEPFEQQSESEAPF